VSDVLAAVQTGVARCDDAARGTNAQTMIAAILLFRIKLRCWETRQTIAGRFDVATSSEPGVMFLKAFDTPRIIMVSHAVLRAAGITAFVIGSSAMPARTQTTTTQLPGTSLEAILGRKGAEQPAGVTRFSFPRSDLTVTVGEVTLKPALALGSWIAFKMLDKGQVLVMGDLVLTEGEVSAVTDALQAGGVEQTALHNHVLRESPRIMYMHISARGDRDRIAKSIRGALEKTGTPLGPPSPPAVTTATDLDTAGIAHALGISGKLNGTVYQVSVPRAERVTEMGTEVPPSMGVATALNFQPTGNGRAAITGDFVLRGSEVNPVIRALRSHGIEVTAVHSHMLDEEPRLFFMHFWANDDAVTLAKGLSAALDKMAVKRK
jgi:hypothetical protein